MFHHLLHKGKEKRNSNPNLATRRRRCRRQSEPIGCINSSRCQSSAAHLQPFSIVEPAESSLGVSRKQPEPVRPQPTHVVRPRQMPVWVRAAPPRYEPCLPPSRAAKLFVSHKPVFGSFPPVLVRPVGPIGVWAVKLFLVKGNCCNLDIGTSLLGKRVLLLNFDRANLQSDRLRCSFGFTKDQLVPTGSQITRVREHASSEVPLFRTLIGN
ncbi:uncharacterized protein E6C27_scaffold285G003960 [Cucumis melo var. makuwa]|uniref:Uncharacterized protein n=1 Tax=Cucumis melo var. makuwa TaxID=1194695 RepID=A0A5A7SWJ1_CUCMM|nr:uncharacterized protein E6C27_scaffold285G003960 [Cucumis melo var. makuwa]